MQEAGRYLVRRKDEIDESLIGKAMVDAHEATDIFFHACEQHIRTIDVEVADSFAVMLKRHRKEIKSATATNDYAFKEQLASSVRTSTLNALQWHRQWRRTPSLHTSIPRTERSINLCLKAVAR